MGLKEKHFPEPHVAVWDENWDALQTFLKLSTQWRMGGFGPIGLDYNVFYGEAARAGIVGDDLDDLMWRISVIESEALAHLRG